MYNPYDILGIPRGSSIEVARAAYRKLAMLHHPDRGGSESKFKEVKQAWEHIESGWSEPVQRPAQQQYQPRRSNTTWSKPEDVWEGYAAKQARAQAAASQAYKTAKPKITPYQQQYVQAYRPPAPPNRKNVGDFIARVSLAEAYRGFICEVNVDGKSHKIRVPAGAPDGLRFTAPIEGLEDVTVVVRINQSLYSFTSLDYAISENTMVNGAPERVHRTKDLRVTQEVLDRDLRQGLCVQMLDFLGQEYTVKVPRSDTSRPVTVKVEGKGYVDWFSTLKQAGTTRGDVYVTLVPTETVEMSHLRF